jgi:pimeloyl-ACP methyl ester carboxylesterase
MPHAIDPTTAGDAQIIAWLAGGEHAPLLRVFFGDSEYEQLRSLAVRAVKKKLARAPRVYLLPGIMGSTLGWEAGAKRAAPPTGQRAVAHSERVWLNPHAIGGGGLLSLALPAKRAPQALGVMLPGYLKLQLHLMLAGFNVLLHAYDWRQSVLVSGRTLLRRLQAERVKDVLLVGHSMGGLVARAALAADRGKPRAKKTKRIQRIARIVQVGAPNSGAFSMVQALRGAYPTVRKLAALDPLHTTDQLVRHVFRTLPGLYELLPAPLTPDALDLWQPQNWPDDLLGPDATLLAAARRARDKLAAACPGCFNIVGVGQETATQLRLRGNMFEYAMSAEGDGTVSRAAAEWPNAPTWYVDERHGNLVNHPLVCQAIADLLLKGRTRALPQDPPALAGVTRWVSDADLRSGPVGNRDGKVEWMRLSLDERRRILEPVISAEFAAATRPL